MSEDACSRARNALFEVCGLPPDAERFRNITVSLDGGPAQSPYSSVGPSMGNVIEVAEDMYKGSLSGDSADAREYLDKLIRFPDPRDDDGERVILEDETFYFTELGYREYVQSVDRMSEVLRLASDVAISPTYREVDVFVDVLIDPDPADVVYRDEYQIAVSE